MINSAEFQMDFLKRLAFNRFGGTENEKKASEIILAQIEELGGSGSIEEFKIPGFSIERAFLQVTEPFTREIEVTGYGRSGSTDGVIEGELYYAEQGEEDNFSGAEGKIVLLNAVTMPVFERLKRSGALAFLTVSGNYHDDRDKTDLDQRYFRQRTTDKYGQLPGLCMRTEDGIALLKDGARRVRMELRGRDEEHTSRNVVSFIEGTEFPHKEILFTAHYDSILFGDGAWDNASGSANIMEIYRHYLASPPRHSMRFIWCGAEEQGLLGSKAYVEAHPEELDKILLCENFDMTGTILGSHNLILAGTEELKYYIKFIAKESGFVTRLTEDVHHSDSSPFANKGIPAIGYTRGGYSSYHTRYDKLWPLSAERLNESSQFAITVTDRIDKLEDTVFERAVSSTMAEKLKNYIEPKD